MRVKSYCSSKANNSAKNVFENCLNDDILFLLSSLKYLRKLGRKKDLERRCVGLQRDSLDSLFGIVEFNKLLVSVEKCAN